MKVMYFLNIIVAGYIGLISISNPQLATKTIFSNVWHTSEVTRLVGCLWLSIAVLSVAGIVKPVAFSPVFVLQLLYKGTWLLAVALPSLIRNQSFPIGMTMFFLVWVIILPLIIPWKNLIG